MVKGRKTFEIDPLFRNLIKFYLSRFEYVDSILFYHYFINITIFLYLKVLVPLFPSIKPQQKAETNNFFHSLLPFIFYQLAVRGSQVFFTPHNNKSITILGIPKTYSLPSPTRLVSFQYFIVTKFSVSQFNCNHTHGSDYSVT